MNKYVKENPRISVKFVDSDSEETLFEVNGRNWTNIGELFTDHIVNSIIDGFEIINTVGDGSCFIHALFTSVSETYRKIDIKNRPIIFIFMGKIDSIQSERFFIDFDSCSFINPPNVF